MRFVDLHSHLLPGVDDGPSSVDETVEMLRLAHAGGTGALVATPHFFLPPWDRLDPALLASSFRRLTEHLTRLAGEDATGEYAFLEEITLYPGAENYISPEFFEALDRGAVVTLNNTRYVLIELPPFLSYEVARSAVERILTAGLLPVLAHVERYPFLHQGSERLAGLLAGGCVAQLNAATVLGAAGRAQTRLASRLLDRGLVQVIASDGHGAGVRRPDLGRAAAALSKKYPSERVALWLRDNAARILDDRAPLGAAGRPRA